MWPSHVDRRILDAGALLTADGTDNELIKLEAAPKDYKLEQRPCHATSLSLWFRDALRECWAWACFYGQEHYPEQERAAQFLLGLNEKQDYCWPPKVIFGAWCELRGRWCEELRMKRRELMEILGDESPFL